MDHSTLNTDENALPAGLPSPRHAAPRHAAPRLTAPGLAATSLADEVRATLLLFGMVLLVILGFGLASTLVLRLLAS